MVPVFPPLTDEGIRLFCLVLWLFGSVGSLNGDVFRTPLRRSVESFSSTNHVPVDRPRKQRVWPWGGLGGRTERRWQHMHIVNDNSSTFDIRLGGEARVPVSRELILALAAKKKQLLALCESTLRTPRCESHPERAC